MSEWKECKIGDIVTLEYGKGLKDYRDGNGKYDVFGTNGKIGFTNEFLYDRSSVIIGRKGAYREVHLAKQPFFVIDTAFYTKTIIENLDNRFLYYWFKNIDINEMDSGSAIPSTSRDEVYELAILLPPFPEQRAIASVLSSLDDKIDLLHRQNKTLETMAETLFRQWFVEEADEGWEEVDLDYVTQRITDGAHKSPPTVDVGLPMASVKDMHQWGIHHDSCRKISETDYMELVRNDCRPLKDDIIIAKDGSYLKHVFVAPNDLDLVILSSIAILRPNGKYNPLLLSIYLKMNSTHEALENIVTGAVIPRIVLKDFRKFKLTLPPMKLQIKALKTLEPIYMKCWENVNQISTLEKLRDTLLPKLMSGEVRVKLEQQEVGT